MAFRLEKRVSTWRKVAMAAWDKPNDPTVYGTLTVDAGPALAYLTSVREKTGIKATVTHLVGRAVALALRETPDINGRIVGRRLLMRDTVDIFYQVVMDNGKELSGAKIDRADEKDVHDIAKELVDKAERIRARQDPQFESSKSAIDKIPSVFRRPVLRFLSYLTNDRGWSIRSLKLPADAFGSAMVTSVGMFGIDIGYSPIFPLSGTPLLILVGEVQDRAVVQDGQVVVRPMLNLNVSFDHRFIDGFHAGKMSRSVRRYFAAPAEFEVAYLQKILPPLPP
jgi:pyruvate dehydrogenase E2 component (dihydrolipoamide acetyltransferase)